MYKNKKHSRLLLAALATSALTTSVASQANTDDPIRIGIMLPFSGVYAALGDAGRNGLKMAIEENSAQLNGRKA